MNEPNFPQSNNQLPGRPAMHPDPRNMTPPMAAAMPNLAAQTFAPQVKQQQFRPPAPPVNPLMKHFRQPAMYIKLTSEGKYWPDGTIDIPVTGELPVYPMTAKDEIILRTPDALLNGTSVVQVIQSCVPNIKDAWAMPSVDVDSTLIAIRIASFGQYMTVSAKCPHCGEEHDYDIDLHKTLAQIQMPDYSQLVTTKDGLQILLKPLNYMQVSKAGSVAFEEDRLIQSLADPAATEETRKTKYAEHVKRMIELSVENATNCTQCILADGQEVTDSAFIKEYYQNAESTVIRDIQDKVKTFAESVSIKSEDTMCTSCGKQFKLNIEFDYSHFFAKSS